MSLLKTIVPGRIARRVTLFLLAMSCGPLWSLAASERDYKKQIEPLLKNYCFDCHGDGVNKGEVAVLYCFIFLFIFFYGPGRLSIDALIARSRGNTTTP